LPLGDEAFIWIPAVGLAALAVVLSVGAIPLAARVLGALVLAGAAFLTLLGPDERALLVRSVAMRSRGQAAPLQPVALDAEGERPGGVV
jgi:hypothetical protein